MGAVGIARKGSFLGALALSLIWVSLAAAPGCAEKEPLQIGFAGGLSGRVADLGISGRNGAILAVEERNEAGGVRGRPVRLVVRDDEQDPSTALRVDREMIALGVEAVIGHMTSAMTEAAVPLMNESGTVMVSPTTTTTYLTGLDDYFIRVSATTREYASRMAGHLRGKEGVETVSAVYDLRNRAYTESWLEEFRREFDALGGRILETVAYESGPEVHFLEVAEKALAPRADGLIIVTSAMDAAMICQQVRKGGSDVLLVAAEWAGTEKLMELGGSAVEGLVVSQFFDRESTDPGYLEWRERYRARFGEEPGFASVNSYDAASLVLQALERRRAGESLKAAILNVGSLMGVQGKVMIDRFGDADRPTFIATVRAGRFQVVE